MQNCVLSHACVKATGHDRLSSSIALHFKILRQGLSLNVNPANSARLVCWANSHDPLCVCPTVRDYGHTVPQPYFVLFIVQWRGGRSRDRIFCHPGHPWTPIFFPPTPMGLEHRHCFQHDYWQIFKVTVCQGWGLLVQWKNTQPALKINCLIPSTDCGIKDYETCSNKRKRLYTKYVHGNKTNISPLVGFFPHHIGLQNLNFSFLPKLF